jgi:hypothetical protein
VPTKPFTQYRYGTSADLFVAQKPRGESIVFGGTGQEHGRWTRVLTQRAAKQLWFKLTGLLFPSKAEKVTALAVTSPLRGGDKPTITTHLEVTRTANGLIEVIGWAGEDTWWVSLSEAEARTLWPKLDLLLFPVGWEGRQNKPGRSSAS